MTPSGTRRRSTRRPFGPHARVDALEQWVGIGRDLAQGVGHGVDARARQGEPVDARAGLPVGRDVPGVDRQQFLARLLEAVGDVQQHGAALLVGGLGEDRGGLSNRATLRRQRS